MYGELPGNGEAHSSEQEEGDEELPGWGEMRGDIPSGSAEADQARSFSYLHISMASEHSVANEDLHHDMCCIARPGIARGDQEISFFVACEDDISNRHLHHDKRCTAWQLSRICMLRIDGRAVPMSAVRGNILLSCKGSDKEE